MSRNDLISKIGDESTSTVGVGEIDFDISLGYDPRKIEAFLGYLINKSTEKNNQAICFVGKENEGDSIRYKWNSWSERQEKNILSYMSRKAKNPIWISMVGLLRHSDLDDFKESFCRREITEKNIYESMKQFCYDPSDQRSESKNLQILIYVEENNPNEIIRRPIKRVINLSRRK